MPALRKKENCRNWFACFTLPDGRRVQRSTGTSDRKSAERLALQYEEATRKARTSRQAQRVIRDIYASLTGDALKSRTLNEYLKSWLARKKGEIRSGSLKSYKSKLDRLVKFLGAKADGDITFINGQDILNFRVAEAERVSARTVNNAIKSIRVFFEDAKRDGLIGENPATEVKVLKVSATSSRRPFTVDEIKAVLAVADKEWRSMILFGLYTGQRLQDITQLTWENIDLEAKEVRLVTSKTHRTVAIPLCQPLETHITGLEVTDDPGAPLHPRALGLFKSAGKSGTLSRQFADVLATAGLRVKQSHEKRGDGRDGRRQSEPLSFHSFRHTATSLMKNAGISPAIVQDIIGHESKEVSRLYTHIDSDSKKTAVDALPDVTQ
jgi:integrase